MQPPCDGEATPEGNQGKDITPRYLTRNGIYLTLRMFMQSLLDLLRQT